MHRPAPLLLLAMVSVAACGSARPASRVSGRQVFATDCSLCHSLSGQNTPHQQGGDLLRARLSRVELTQFTREMPVRHRLSAAELRAVVGYVAGVERRG